MIKATSKYFVLICFLLLFFCLWFIGNSFTGLNLLCRNISKLVPGQLTIELASGSLNQQVNIKHFSYQLHGLKIQADDLQLKVNLATLLLNDVRISKLHAKQLQIILPKSTEKASTNQTPRIDMPIKIYASDIAIQHFTYQQAKTHFQLNQVSFNATIKPDSIRVSPLAITQNKQHYQLMGKLDFSPLQANFELTRQQDNAENIHGQFSAHGTWQKMQLDSVFTLPVQLKTHLQVSDVLSSPTWKATGSIKDLGLLQKQRFMGDFSASGDTQTLALKSALHSEQKEHPGTINLMLASPALSKQKIHLNLKWQNLLLSEKPQLESLNGQLDLKGIPSHYQLQVKGQVQGTEVPNSNVNLLGQGSLQQLQLQQLALNTLQGTLQGTGKITWKPKVNYHINLLMKNLNPEAKWINWPGDISSQLTLKGDSQHLAAKLFNLSGTLHKQPLSGSLRANLQSNNLSTATGDITVGHAHLAAHYAKHGASNLSWDINIPVLEKILPMARGRLVTKGNLQHHGDFIDTSGQISTSNFTWQHYHADHFSAEFAVNTNPKLDSIIALNSNNIKVGQYQFEHVDLNLSGKNPKRKLDLSIQNAQGILHLNATSNLLADNYLFNVTRLELLSNNFGNWQLTRPFNLHYENQRFNLHNFSWRAKQQQISADLVFHKQQLHKLNIHIKNLALNLFNFILPTDINLVGQLNLNTDYTLSDNKINASGKVDLVNSKIFYPSQHQEQKLVINHAQINYNVKDNFLHSQAKLRFNDNNNIHVKTSLSNLSFKNFWQQNHLVTGNISSNMPTLDILQAFVPSADQISGQFKMHFKWDGSILEPNLTGQASIKQAEIKLLTHGVDLKKVNLVINAAQHRVNYDLSTQSGKGQLALKGESIPNKMWETHLKLQGKNFTIDDTPRFNIIVSPNLQLSLKKQRIDLTGKIRFPEAKLNLLQYNSVSSLPSDVEIIRAGTAQSNQSWANYLYTQLDVELGNNVELQTKLLSAKLAGKVQLIDTPHGETTANGELTITKGLVTAFGQKLNITDGKLLYAGGSTTNPGLRIKATKTIKTFVDPTQNSLTNTSLSPAGDSTTASTAASQQINVPMQRKDIVVGVSVSNTLQQPHIMLFSDQADLTQADILSYLVLGYPMSKANNQQGEALLQAANAITSGDNQVSGLISTIRDTLQLNQVGFQSTNYLDPSSNTVQENTSLVLGKMLSPKLFIRYSIGLILPINTISASYSFDKNWSLQTESNSLGNGLDLLYSWEQN